MKLSRLFIRALWLAVLLLTASLSANAQSRTGTISGRVITEDGQPLPRAVVSIFGVGGSLEKMMSGRLAVATDAEGRFEATGLDPMPYVVMARAPSYLLAQKPDPAGLQYHFVGETVTIVLRKGGVITGRVTGATGEPVVGVEVKTVSAEMARLSGLGPFFDFSSGQLVARQTDDRGIYRLYGVAPGKYFIVAGTTGISFAHTPTPFSGKSPTYHPASTRETATLVTVQSGEELGGIDIRYRGERGFAISGKVSGLAASNPINVQSATLILLRRTGTQDVVAMTMLLPIGGQNGYAIYGVPNGDYEIVAAQTNAADDDQSAAPPRRITVNNADLNGIDLALAPLAAIKGKVVLERAAPAAAPKCESQRESHLNEVVLFSRKDDPHAKTELDLATLGAQSPSIPDPQGAFSLRGLTAGRYRVAAQLPDANWYLKSLALTPANPAMANPSRDGLAVKAGEKLSGLTVTIATGAASVKGAVKAAAGARLPVRLRVQVLPAEAEAKDDVLRFAQVEVESSGAFSFEHLAPGKYLVLVRAVPTSDLPDKPERPVAWETAERAKLRKEAEAANALVELKACQRLTEFVLTWK
jgi:hypothetical protein